MPAAGMAYVQDAEDWASAWGQTQTAGSALEQCDCSIPDAESNLKSGCQNLSPVIAMADWHV